MPDLVCSTVLVTPLCCCYGSCLDTATSAIVVATSKGSRTHHRCPTHLEWSRERENVESEHPLEPAP